MICEVVVDSCEDMLKSSLDDEYDMELTGYVIIALLLMFTLGLLLLLWKRNVQYILINALTIGCELSSPNDDSGVLELGSNGFLFNL